MNHCPETLKVQDWLDGELPPDAAVRFEAHLAGCHECEAEATAYRVVFSELRAVPLLDPRPELFERIMEQVLPHHMPRWAKVLGWAYGGAFAASLAAIGSAFVLPGPSAWLHGVIAAGMRSLTNTGTFVLRTLGEGAAQLFATLAGEGSIGSMFKFMWAVLAQPAVLLTLIAALAVCAAVLWWMRPRERRTTGEISHVGMLGL